MELKKLKKMKRKHQLYKEEVWGYLKISQKIKIDSEILVFLRPFDPYSIDIKDKSKILGKKVNRDMKKGESIKWDDLD